MPLPGFEGRFARGEPPNETCKAQVYECNCTQCNDPNGTPCGTLPPSFIIKIYNGLIALINILYQVPCAVPLQFLIAL